MNPTTTLDEQDIVRICAANDIEYVSSRRITDGFTNEVHCVSVMMIVAI